MCLFCYNSLFFILNMTNFVLLSTQFECSLFFLRMCFFLIIRHISFHPVFSVQNYNYPCTAPSTKWLWLSAGCMVTLAGNRCLWTRIPTTCPLAFLLPGLWQTNCHQQKERLSTGAQPFIMAPVWTVIILSRDSSVTEHSFCRMHVFVQIHQGSLSFWWKCKKMSKM